MTFKKSRFFVISLMLLIPGLILGEGAVKVNIVGQPPAGFDPQWVINTVDPYLQEISTPVRDEITIEFIDGLVIGTVPCDGHIYFGTSVVPLRNAHNLSEVANSGLIHEYILARYTPCRVDASASFLEGLATAKGARLLEKLNASDSSILKQTSQWNVNGLNAAHWKAAGGSATFFDNPSLGYACTAGYYESLVVDGDYRAFDNALTTDKDHSINEILDSVVGKVNGILPSTFLSNTKCAWTKPIGFSTDADFLISYENGINFNGWLDQGAVNPLGFYIGVFSRKDGLPTRIKSVDVTYSVTGVNGKVILSETMVGYPYTVVMYPQEYPKLFSDTLPTGAYKREVCANGCVSPFLREVKYFFVRNDQAPEIFTRGQLMLVANGPGYEDFTPSTQIELTPESKEVGYVLTHVDGGVIIEGPVGDFTLVDSRGNVRTRRIITNASILDFWTQFDDVVLIDVVDMYSNKSTKDLFIGGWLELTTVGASHNDPDWPAANSQNPTQGCVGQDGTTSVVFQDIDGTQHFGSIQYCSSTKLQVIVPEMAQGTAKVFVKLNGALSDAVDMTVN